jgi:ABC-2 type transport system ATP-binding protein
MDSFSLSPALEVVRLAAGYGVRKILRDISFTLHPGEILGIIGPNGAGKSTLIDTVTGLLRPLEGSVRIASHNPISEPLAARHSFGVALSASVLPRFLTGRQYLEMVAEIRSERLDALPVEDPIGRLGLTPWIDAAIGTYSLGTAMKLSICAALIGAPPLLIFDESTNGLDPVAGFEFKRIMTELRQAGHAILLTTHALEIIVRLCDRTLMLSEGTIGMQWSRDEMTEARLNPEGFESAIVAMLRQNRAHV